MQALSGGLFHCVNGSPVRFAPRVTRSSSHCANVSGIALHADDGFVERFLRGIEFVHDQRRATLFLEGQ
jgi:hypothetical protein